MTFKKHTKKEIEMLSLALRMTGIACTEAAAEQLLLVQHELKFKGGRFNLKDAATIERYIKEKYFKIKDKK